MLICFKAFVPITILNLKSTDTTRKSSPVWPVSPDQAEFCHLGEILFPIFFNSLFTVWKFIGSVFLLNFFELTFYWAIFKKLWANFCLNRLVTLVKPFFPLLTSRIVTMAFRRLVACLELVRGLHFNSMWNAILLEKLVLQWLEKNATSWLF